MSTQLQSGCSHITRGVLWTTSGLEGSLSTNGCRTNLGCAWEQLVGVHDHTMMPLRWWCFDKREDVPRIFLISIVTSACRQKGREEGGGGAFFWYTAKVRAVQYVWDV